ncbi:MAG: peptide/nickel transport system permease protein [Chloroflexi bacterium]|nr:MAG: peptide/nickel transport system permease protein [Chloroflexota bacterium]
MGLIIVTLAVISLAIFAIVEILPGDVAKMMLKQNATEESLDRLREQLGLYRPWYERYFDWVWGVLRGDWGTSYVTGIPISEILGRRVVHSLALALFALVFGIPLAVLAGIWAGIRPDRLADRIMSMVGMVGISMPEFVTGVIFMLVLASKFELLPPTSMMLPGETPWTRPQILVLPALTLTVVLFAYIMRMTRASVIEVMQSAYVRTATLKGIPMHQVVRRHVLPNAMLPTITIIAANMGYMLGGLIIVENVFAYPGLGQMLLFSIQQRDFPLLESLVLLIAGTYAISNLLADLSYAALDPRIRVS